VNCYGECNTLAKCVIPAKAGIQHKIASAAGGFLLFDATVKSPKNAAKTTPTLQNWGGKVLLTLASCLLYVAKMLLERQGKINNVQ